MAHPVAECITLFDPYFIPIPTLNDTIPRRCNKALDPP